MLLLSLLIKAKDRIDPCGIDKKRREKRRKEKKRKKTKKRKEKKRKRKLSVYKSRVIIEPRLIS